MEKRKFLDLCFHLPFASSFTISPDRFSFEPEYLSIETIKLKFAATEGEA
jgi:hypothetical protein